MTLEQYLVNVHYPVASQRRGQWAFNLLFEVRPDLANKVRSTDLDPFYNDGLIPVFLQWVEENWNVKGSA